MKKNRSCMVLLIFIGLVSFYGRIVYAEEATNSAKVKVTYTVSEQDLEESSHKDSLKNPSDNQQGHNEVKKRKTKLFPQTNERRTIFGSFLGMFLIVLIGILYGRKTTTENSTVETEE